jgi:hypothetical protein
VFQANRTAGVRLALRPVVGRFSLTLHVACNLRLSFF